MVFRQKGARLGLPNCQMSTNKEAISNATMNLMESSMMNVGGMLDTCKSDRKWCF